MESITEPIERYTIYTKILKCRQTDLGWWVLVEGSWEWFLLGREELAFAPGDHIKITLEKLHAKPSRPSE